MMNKLNQPLNESTKWRTHSQIIQEAVVEDEETLTISVDFGCNIFKKVVVTRNNDPVLAARLFIVDHHLDSLLEEPLARSFQKSMEQKWGDLSQEIKSGPFRVATQGVFPKTQQPLQSRYDFNDVPEDEFGEDDTFASQIESKTELLNCKESPSRMNKATQSKQTTDEKTLNLQVEEGPVEIVSPGSYYKQCSKPTNYGLYDKLHTQKLKGKLLAERKEKMDKEEELRRQQPVVKKPRTHQFLSVGRRFYEKGVKAQEAKERAVEMVKRIEKTKFKKDHPFKPNIQSPDNAGRYRLLKNRTPSRPRRFSDDHQYSLTRSHEKSQQRAAQRVLELRMKKQEKEMAECTFSPRISKSSQEIIDKKINRKVTEMNTKREALLSKDKHWCDMLYQDASARRDRQTQIYDIAVPSECTFQPKVIPYSNYKKWARRSHSVNENKRYRSCSCDKTQVNQEEIRNLTFKPLINKTPVKPSTSKFQSPSRPISPDQNGRYSSPMDREMRFTALHEDAQERQERLSELKSYYNEDQQQNYQMYRKSAKKSNKIHKKSKRDRFAEIFHILDADRDGFISFKAVSFERLDSAVTKIILPILNELEFLDSCGGKIDKMEFIEAGCRLFKGLQVPDRQIILQFSRIKRVSENSGQKECTFSPNLEKSQRKRYHPSDEVFRGVQAAPEMISGRGELLQTGIQIQNKYNDLVKKSFHDRQSFTVDKVKKRLEELREIKRHQEIEGCSFQPQTNKIKHRNQVNLKQEELRQQVLNQIIYNEEGTESDKDEARTSAFLQIDNLF